MITGASSGIGKAVAYQMAEKGYAVALTATRQHLVDEIRKDIEAQLNPPKVISRALDVTDHDDVFKAVDEIGESLGGLNIVFANAAIGYFFRQGGGHIVGTRFAKYIVFFNTRLGVMPFKQMFLDKPEKVVDFSDETTLNHLRGLSNQGRKLAIVEIAGRDSVAAAVKSVAADGFTDLLPVYAYTGTEYGPWAMVERAVARLEQILPNVEIHPLMIMGSPDFWRALNGRFLSALIRRLGFFSPCPGCHLYLHAVRIPLAWHLGGVPIITGERESHSGTVKINQTASAINFYFDFARRFDTELKFPLQHVSSGETIEELLHIPWERGKEQLQCVLSGNYRELDQRISIPESGILTLLEKFAGPAAEQIILSYLDGHEPDHAAAARSVLTQM